MPDWPAIYDAYAALAWRVAYRITGHDADAADCVQRAFLGAVEVAGRETVRNWPALLTRLATARALDCLRERSRHQLLPLDGELPAFGDDPIELATASELADALRLALTRIDPSQAEAFCLTALDGFTNPQAATALGRTANHVGVLVYRARAALRAELKAFDTAGEPS